MLYLFLVGVAWSCPSISLAQDKDKPDQVHPLALKEEMVRDRFTRFEDRIFRLRDQLENSEPENAERLKRVLQRAGELGLADRLDALLPLFRDESALDRAMAEQSKWLADADRLLAILTQRDSDNEERKAEIERLQDYHEQLNKLLEKQRSLRGETGQSGGMQRMGQQIDQALKRAGVIKQKQQALADGAKQAGMENASAQAKEQEALSSDAKELAKDIKQLAEQAAKSAEQAAAMQSAGEEMKSAAESAGKSSQQMSQAADKMKSGDASSAEQKQKEAQKALDDAIERLQRAKDKLDQSSDAQNLSEQQKQVADATGGLSQQMKQESSNSGSQQQQGGQRQQGGQQKSGQQQSSSSKPTPGQQSLEQAQQEMNDASQALDQQDPDKATPPQDRAIDQLEQAQKELEEALKQLREEEKVETLRDLESRFRELLTKQRGINGTTLQLAKIGEKNFQRAEHLELAELSSKQRNLGDDAATCLHILDEDGTTIVFPRVVEQISKDMGMVADRLADRKVGALTQSVQEEIVDALEQLLEAVKKMQQDAQQGQQMAAGQPGESPLLPESAELKLLRASQMRVNTRTAAIETERDEASDSPDVLQRALKTVAMRQKEIAETAQHMRDSGGQP